MLATTVFVAAAEAPPARASHCNHMIQGAQDKAAPLFAAWYEASAADDGPRICSVGPKLVAALTAVMRIARSVPKHCFHEKTSAPIEAAYVRNLAMVRDKMNGACVRGRAKKIQT
ncbi:MAG: hypothetical protein ABL904_16590 [Hyphomicrobiaceae bacterium]